MSKTAQMVLKIVAAGLARRCHIELAYAIGVSHPVSVLVDSQGTGKVSDERLSQIVGSWQDMAKGCGCLKERLRKRRCSEYDDYNDAELYQ